MKPNFNKLHNSIPNILPLPIAVILNNTYDTNIYIYTHTHTQLSYNSVPNILPVSVPTAVFLNLYDVYMHITHTHTQKLLCIHTCMYLHAATTPPLHTHTRGDRHTSLSVLPSSRASSASCAAISSCWRRISCDSSSSELHSRWIRALLASSSRRRSSSCWSASCDGQTTQGCQLKSGQGRQKRENGQVVMALD